MSEPLISFEPATGEELWRGPVSDVDAEVEIARRAWPEFKGNGGHGLGHLKQALSLQFHHHDAGEDARAAAQVVLHAEIKTGRSFVEILARQAAKFPRAANPHYEPFE